MAKKEHGKKGTGKKRPAEKKEMTRTTEQEVKEENVKNDPAKEEPLQEEKPEEKEEPKEETASSTEGNGKKEAKEKKPKKKLTPKQKKAAVITGVCAACAVCAAYVGPSVYYNNHFFPHTTVGSIDISGKSEMIAQRILENRIADYSLTMNERGDTKFKLSSETLGAKPGSDDLIKNLMASQNGFKWPAEIKKDHKKELEISYDKKSVSEKLDNQIKAHNASSEEPVSAKIYYNAEEGKFDAEKETEGNTIDKKATMKAIDEAVGSLQEELDMDTAGCYEKPAYAVGTKEFDTQLALANTMNAASITYEGDGIETKELTSEDIHGWIVVDNENMKVSLNETKINEFISGLEDDYGTFGETRTFTTHDGRNVEVAGEYGWKVDKEEESAYLKNAISSGKQETHEPSWSKKAASHDPDWGSEYVEVDLSAQKIFYIKDGSESMTADIVSGDVKTSHETTKGILEVSKNDTRDGILITLSDNTTIKPDEERTEFGGRIYEENGTGDGSIVLSGDDAESLSKLIKKGRPVIIYGEKAPGTADAVTAQNGTADTTAATADNVTYNSIFNDYAKKLDEKTTELVNEYKKETKDITDITKLESIKNEKVASLKALLDEGTKKMEDLKKSSGDTTDTCDRLIKELTEYHATCEKKITDKYFGTNSEDTEQPFVENKKYTEEDPEDTQIPHDYREDVTEPDLPNGYFNN